LSMVGGEGFEPPASSV